MSKDGGTKRLRWRKGGEISGGGEVRGMRIGASDGLCCWR